MTRKGSWNHCLLSLACLRKCELVPPPPDILLHGAYFSYALLYFCVYVNYWHSTLFKPGTRVIKNHPNRDLIRKEKSGTERTIATAASLYKRHARWKWRRWRILNGRVSIDFLFKKWEVNSALLRFLTVQWRNLPLIVYCLFQFKSFHVFSHGYGVLSISVSRVSFIVHQSWPTAGGEMCNSNGYDARCCFTAPFHLQCRAAKSKPSQTRFKAWRITANTTIKWPGTAEKGFALQDELLNGRPTSAHRR